MTEQTLPDDIRAALLKKAKGWMLTRYVGGSRQLEAWSDHYAHLTTIYSFSLPGKTSANLRRLVKLTASGLLIERTRWRAGVGVREFTAPRPVLDEIGLEAQRYWESVGYRVGEMMKEIPQ